MNKLTLWATATAVFALVPTIAEAQQNKGAKVGGGARPAVSKPAAIAPRPAVSSQPMTLARPGGGAVIKGAGGGVAVRGASGFVGGGGVFIAPAPYTSGFPQVNSGGVYSNFSLVNSGSVFTNPSLANTGTVFGVTSSVVRPIGGNSLFSNVASPFRWSGGTAFLTTPDWNTTPAETTIVGGPPSGYSSGYPQHIELNGDKQTTMPGVDIAHLKRPGQRLPASVQIQVPMPDAELWFNGVKMHQTGQTRQFVTPELATGESYTYEVRARWRQNGKEFDQTHTVTVHGGGQVEHAFLLNGKEILPPPVTKILP